MSKMINHDDRWIGQTMKHAAGKLVGPEASKVEKHMDTCADCQQIYNNYRYAAKVLIQDNDDDVGHTPGLPPVLVARWKAEMLEAEAKKESGGTDDPYFDQALHTPSATNGTTPALEAPDVALDASGGLLFIEENTTEIEVLDEGAHREVSIEQSSVETVIQQTDSPSQSRGKKSRSAKQ
jgi:hypothetical protein